MPRSNVGSWSSDSSSASDLEKTHLHDGSDHEDGRKAGGEKVHHQEYVDTAFSAPSCAVDMPGRTYDGSNRSESRSAVDT